MMLNLLNLEFRLQFVLRFILISFTSLVLVSCGSKDGSSGGSSSVRIKMPDQLRSSKLNSSAGILELSQAPGDEFNDIWATSFQPENTAQLNCFGVVVGGPDESLRSNKCRFSGGNDLVYGVQFMGALPGETVSLAVPSGEDREIRILAWQAENEAACQSLTQGAAVESRQLSHPFVIAAAVQSLEPGDVAISIDASLDDAEELINCDVFIEKIGSLSTRKFDLGGEIVNNKPAEVPGNNLELQLMLQPNFGQNSAAAIHKQIFTNDGAFKFDFPISDGQLFTVSITQQPAGKNCSVENNQGIIFGDSAIGPVIECEDVPFKVGGVVVGLDEDAPITEELELGFIIGGDLPEEVQEQEPRPIGGEGDLDPIAADTSTETETPTEETSSEPNEVQERKNGAFQFATDIFHNENFQVVVTQQPTGQECEVNQGSGTINNASISNVAVSCDPLIFTVGGTLDGLIAGRSVKIKIETSVEGGEPLTSELTLTEDAGYVFPTPVVFDNPYEVTVVEQPAGMSCSVENGSDIIGPDHVENANVICEPLPFKVIPTISGIIASREIQVQVSFPGVDHFFNTTENGTFDEFPPGLSNETYLVNVSQRPLGHTCVVVNPTGVLFDSDITDVEVNCTPTPFNLSGNVSGVITGRNLAIQLNGEETIPFTADGPFNFETQLLTGQLYNVAITQTPIGETCEVINGSGEIVDNNITNISVECEPIPFNVGGVLAGLIDGRSLGLTLNDGFSTLNVTANGSYVFADKVLAGDNYSVAISAQPVGQTCTIAEGTSSGTIIGSDITNIDIVCVPLPFAVGGTISGVLPERDLTIVLNGEIESITRSTNGTFEFETQILSGQTYNVSVVTEPPGQECSVENASGTILGSDISNINVICVPLPFAVGGTLEGLIQGRSLDLSLNGEFDSLTLTSDGSFAFANDVLAGQNFDVQIVNQPVGQSCTIEGNTGSIFDADINSVAIACEPLPFTVGGNVTGLITERSVELVLNGEVDTVVVSENGTFAFSTQVLSGNNYTVAVLEQPPGQECTLENASGTILGEDITDVAVTCVPLPFSVGGTIAGIIADRTIELQVASDTQTTTQTFPANGTEGVFQFEETILSGKPYTVTVATQPLGHTCTVANGAGTIFDSNITDVAVTCEPIQFTISGTQSGLISGRSVQIGLDNAEELRTLSVEDTAFTFESTLVTGQIYNISILSQPAGMECSLENASAEIINSNITDIAVTCVPLPFSVGGTVAGLIEGRTLGLTLNTDEDSLNITADGAFVFANQVLSGNSYSVEISQQPVGMTCEIENNTGDIFDANITDVAVTCTPIPFSVGFTLAGLIDGRTVSLRLQSDGETIDDLTLESNNAEVVNFTNQINSGQPYEVVVLTQAPGQDCTVANGTGTIIGNNITDVAVTCVPLPFTVSGAVSGILGEAGTVTVRVTSSDTNFQDFQLANEAFTSFDIDSGLSFTVTVESNAPNHTCSVENGEGVVFDSNIDNVAVTCEPVPFPVGGVLAGLHPGHSITLQNNAGDDLVLTANGEFTFATEVPFFSPYSVTISSLPDFQDCEIVNGSGTVLAAVSDIQVSCDPPVFPHNLTVTGIETSDSLSYQLVKVSNGEPVSNVTTGNVQNLALGFLPLNLDLKVRGIDLVTGHDCTVSMENGIDTPFLLALADSAESFTVNSGAINVTITCVPQTFLVNVDVEGIIDGRTVTLVNDHSDQQQDTLTIGVDAPFSTEVAFLQPFNVTVSQNPAGQDCTVTNGSGVMGTEDVTVNVDCVALPFSIGVNVTGLIDGRTLEVTNIVNQVNDNLVIEADGETNFTDQVNSGEVFNVSVVAQPVGQNCTIAQGDETGTVVDQDILVDVTCVPLEFNIGGTTIGIPQGNAVELSNTATGSSENLLVSTNGAFVFPTKVASGESFSIDIVNEPIHHSCSVTGGTGSVLDQDITTPVVSCVQDEFTISGTVTGLAPSAVLDINLNEAETFQLTGDPNGLDLGFTFSTTLANNDSFVVFVENQPEGQTCEIENGSGRISESNVSDVLVTCTDNPLIAVGVVDTSFNSNTGSLRIDLNGATESAPKLELDSQNRIAMAFESTVEVPEVVTCRVNSDGSSDSTFNSGSCRSYVTLSAFNPVTFADLAIDPNTDQLLLTGQVESPQNAILSMYVAKVADDGTVLDDTFANGSGVQARTSSCGAGGNDDDALAMVLDSTSNIFAVGYSTVGDEEQAWWKFLADGNFDNTFTGNGQGVGQTCADDPQAADPERNTAVLLDSQGRLLTARVRNSNFDVVAINATNAQPDGSFVTTPISVQDGQVFSLTEDSQGRVYAAGTTQTEGQGDGFVVRFLSDGTLDSSFANSGTLTINFTTALGVEIARKVLIDNTGNVVVFGDNPDGGFIARFTEAGVLDTTFAVGNGDGIMTFTESIKDGAADADGNLYGISEDVGDIVLFKVN